MFIDIVLAGVQLMLIWLKLTGQYDNSWLVGLLPSFIWGAGLALLNIGGKKK